MYLFLAQRMFQQNGIIKTLRKDGLQGVHFYQKEIILKNRLNNFYKNKRILVAGGTGAIGLQLVKFLSRYSKKIIVIRAHKKNFAKKVYQKT
jgi:FlaA1/EpsC-like NDP-sugar epimerase